MKIKQIILAIALLVGVNGVLLSHAVSAADCVDSSGNKYTSILPCSDACPDGSASTNGTCPDGSKPNSIWGLLLFVIKILTAGIGIAAVGGVIYGSVLYASAADDPGKLKTAKGIIINVVIGLVAYALMYSFLNFIIPGGLFS
jgi:hypothetical protein